jgi:hypothetical protein
MAVQRRKTSTKKQGKDTKTLNSKDAIEPKTTTGTSRSDDTSQNDEDTITKIFMQHPMGVSFLVAAVLYIVYYAYHFILLRHPNYIANLSFGFVNLRPAVHANDLRQVLILGSMGSGADRVNAGLSRNLELETTMEILDAESYFARDGTVSQFLGIRYSSLPKSNVYVADTIKELCVNRSKDAKNAFHPKRYRPLNNCSIFADWSKCHAQACIDFLRDEWGCAVRPEEENGCPAIAPVARVLYLVQHPVRMIQEIMVKFCAGTSKSPHPAFRQLALPWLSPETSNSTCLSQIAWYVVNFNQQMLAARDSGLIHATLKYEELSLCDIAKIADFHTPETVVYPPNIARIEKSCGDRISDEATVKLHLPEIPMKNETIISLPKLTWTDIRKAGDLSLELALRDLCNRLSYDTLMLDEKEFEEQ